MGVLAGAEAELVARRRSAAPLTVEVARGDLARDVVTVHPGCPLAQYLDHCLVQSHAAGFRSSSQGRTSTSIRSEPRRFPIRTSPATQPESAGSQRTSD